MTELKRCSKLVLLILLVSHLCIATVTLHTNLKEQLCIITMIMLITKRHFKTGQLNMMSRSEVTCFGCNRWFFFFCPVVDFKGWMLFVC